MTTDPTILLAEGRTLLDREKSPSLAAEMFQRALDHNPGCLESRYHLAKALFQLGDVQGAIRGFREVARAAQAQSRADVVRQCLKTIAVIVPGCPASSLADILAARRAWSEAMGWARNPVRQPADFPHRDRSPDRPLVVGYVSSFFGHENWMKPVWGLLNAHDRDRFRVRLFSFGPVPGGDHPGSDLRSAWRPHDDDAVFDVEGLTNERVAEVIASQEVDLLVDLNGYSDPARIGLFALRPAPLILGWFNMYATTGVPAYDVLVGDRHVVHPGEEIHYLETVARLPGSYLTFTVGYPVPDVAPSPFANTGRVTFGSLGSRYKITPGVLDAWAAILQRCPGSRLLLRSGANGVPSEQERLRSEFAGRGIDPTRLELHGRAPHFEFLETYGRIDIALDTFPYNGGMTTAEALWQGVPVIAYSGSTWASRTSATLLHEAGLGDWVAADGASYVDLALHKAAALAGGSDSFPRRDLLREQVRRSSACDTVAFARHMERLYRDLWRDRCAG